MTEEPLVPHSSRFVWTLLGISCAVFVFAVARQILPVGSFSETDESLIQLQERLAAERTELHRDLQSELTEWERMNDELRVEIASLLENPTQ